MNEHQDVHHFVTQLTRRHTIQTPYTTFANGDVQTAYHYTQAPALLTQLEHASPSSNGDTRGSNGYASRPAARIEALDTLMHIDKEASAWVKFLGHDDPSTTIACVTRVGSLYPSAPEPCRKQLERDVRSWWTQARITTGYDSPAWRPTATCPLCAAKDTLRVKLADHTAACTGCWETWSGENIALLADHIRLENIDAEDTEVPEEVA